MSTETEPEHRAATVDRDGQLSTDQRAGRPRAGARRMVRNPAFMVAMLAVAAAMWAVVGSHQVFPYLSDDHDEAIYLLQADALAHGHLFPPAPENPESFRPWLSVLSGDRYVLKYSPVHASVIALGTRLGSPRLALGLIAAAVVVLAYLLAGEVLRDRRRAALASAFLACSPLFLIQSVTFLPYASSLLLLMAFALTLLKGMRSGGRLWLWASGFLLGVAVFARPFDAVLFAAPLGLYFLVSSWRDRTKLFGRAGWLALGAALPLVAMLAYYWAATGSPLRSPFSVLEPRDTLGFGNRKITPGHPDLIFTPAHGVYGVIRHVLLTSFWCFGGLLLIGFVLNGLRRRRRGGPTPWLALVAVSVPLGYLFFWGTYGTGLRGSLTAFLGPFYFLPLLVPVTFLAASGFVDFWQRDRFLGALALVSMLTASGYLLARGVQVNLRATREDRMLYSTLAPIRDERAIVFLQPLYGPTLLHPFTGLRNSHDYDGRTVYALDLGEHQDLDVIDDHPGRVAYRFRLEGGDYRDNPPDPALYSSLLPLRVVEQPSLRTTLSLQNPTAEPVVLVTVVMDGRRDTFVVDTQSYAGKAYRAGLGVGRGSVDLSGPVVSHGVEPVDHDGLVISVSVASGSGETPRTLYQREFGWNAAGPSIRVLLPGFLAANHLGAEDPLAELVGTGRDRDRDQGAPSRTR
ncbi:MAG: glycosyltransferase family 39 protein [Actinomycetota bacterium]|nr:glycosyltransferase family 39 protein [Actinomycetota bacterium]